jgi:uncharacterized ion transporter superfamily protein YfcC
MKTSSNRKKWYEWIPHPIVMLFMIIIITTILSYILPAGVFDRELIDGRQRVIPGSYKNIPATPIGLMQMFKALPMGFKTASDIIFLVFASGVMFGVLEKSGMVENTVGTIVKKMGDKRRFLLVVLMTYIYGLLGVMIGFENNIAMVPIAAVMVLALGGDLILAAGVSVGAITVGFGLSPINPYTVGTGHNIAELPLFSGAWLRSILCFLGLTVLAWHNVRYFKRILSDESQSLGIGLNTDGMKLSKPLSDYSITQNNKVVLAVFLLGMVVTLYGIFVHHWYINDLSGVFIMIAIVSAAAAGMNGTKFSETTFEYIGKVAPGAFMVGYATTIKEIMEMGNISDTISHELSQIMMTLPTYASAIFMSISQSAINLIIPSGSGQALATLPIMIPLGEILGLTRQTAILAFQIGDGVTNLFNPALGGLVAMLSLCRVPFDRWLRFIFPATGIILLIAWVFLAFSVYIEYGPA